MKKILCFGDSNTYGFNPLNFSRYIESQRWSGILSKKFNVVECGCNNRSIFNNFGELNALSSLSKYLKKDLTHVVLQIGINDLQFQYDVSLNTFKNKLNNLVDLINPNIKIILLCPNVIDKCILRSYFSQLFDEESIEKSKKLPEIYKNIAIEKNCEFVDLNNIATVSKIDGLHYNAQNHEIIAKYLSKILD